MKTQNPQIVDRPAALYRWVLLAALVAGAPSLGGCDGGAGEATPERQAAGEEGSAAPEITRSEADRSIIYAPDVVLVSEGELSQLAVEDDEVRLGQESPARLRGLEPGAVLVSAGGDGFWRYITEVQEDSSGTRYQTRTARIEEVIQSGKIVLSTDNLSEAPAEVEEIITREQALDGSLIETFTLDKDFGETARLQQDLGHVKLKTSGELKMNPGFQMLVEVDNFTVQRMNVRTFGAIEATVNLELTMHDAANPGALQPFAMVESLSLCGMGAGGVQRCANGRPTVLADMMGQPIQIYPELKMRLGWQGQGGGSVETGFELSGYISSGFDYARGEVTRPVYTNKLKVHPIEEQVEGSAEVEVDVGLQLGMIVEHSGHKWVEATPLDATFRLDAATTPPICHFQSTLTSNSRIRYNLFGLSSNRLIYEDTPLRYAAEAADFPGCSADNTNEAQRCQTGRSNSCPQGSECAAGYCVEKTPLRVTLNWNAPVDLELRVQNPAGEMLKLAPDGRAQPADAGWIAVSSAGPVSGTEPEYGDVTNYTDIAAFRRIKEYSDYRYWVRRGGNLDYDEPIPYQITLYDELEGERLVSGTLAAEAEESVRYLYRSGPAPESQ